MWFLGRVIPFLVVPEEDENWKNYIQLLEIVMAPAISEDEVAELGVLIHQVQYASQTSFYDSYATPHFEVS